MGDVKQEAWECKSCGNDAPCRVEVMFEETEYPHIEEQPRFAKGYWSFCVCSERHDAKWTKCIDEANYATLRTRVARLEEAGKNIMCKIPKTKNDYSGVGYCFGCGVVKWASGQGEYSEECKPDCALQDFRRALEEK